MNLGRLLEVGRPDELYTRPATRFVATFLGAANLLLARQTADGIRIGTTPLTARSQDRGEVRESREHEVVAVLRPQEIELAAARDALHSTYIGAGVVQSRLFTGALERLRVQMNGGCDVTDSHQSGAAVLDVTRTQHEQRVSQLNVGQSVAIGVRRIHVLPTPLSSFTVYALHEGTAQTLKAHPLLEDLATRMKTRVSTQVEPSLGAEQPSAPAAPLAGVAVISGASNAAAQCRWLFERGAGEVLLLPEQSAHPQRVLIHWTGEPVRRATLAVAASVLRHVPAEAMYLGILPDSTPETQRPSGVRDLLDARSEAQAVHGLDMRTELRFGDVERELLRQLTQPAEDEATARVPQMLILGVTDPLQLDMQFAELLAHAAIAPILVVCRPDEPQAISRVA